MTETNQKQLGNTLWSIADQEESFESTFDGLFSEIDLASPKLGKTYPDRNAKLCTIRPSTRHGTNTMLSPKNWAYPP